MNQTGLSGSQNTFLLAFIKARRVHFNMEGCYSWGLLRFLSPDSYSQILRRQLPGLQVLRRIIARARGKRSQQELRRRHARVGATIIDGLVANQPGSRACTSNFTPPRNSAVTSI